MKNKKKESTVMIWILGIFLAAMISGFVNLGIDVFYPSPKYETYCTPEIVEDLPDVYPKQCDIDHKDAMNDYNQKIFWVLAPVGFVLVLIGIVYTNLLANLIGIFGGSFLIIQSIMRNLNNKVMAFITLGLIIILIGYFAFKKSKE
ncbi:hypothetical protein KY361_03195 [Candidatus Woesearchaeota archaeon]|nr:hypothetical protein [Candidatus Woesearchaeota archaeon]